MDGGRRWGGVPLEMRKEDMCEVAGCRGQGGRIFRLPCGVVDIFSLSLNEQFVVGKLCESWSFKWWDYLLRVWYDTRGGCLRVCLV